MSFLSWQLGANNSISNGKKEEIDILDNSNNAVANNSLVVQLYTKQKYESGGPVHDSFGIGFAIGNDNGLTPMDAVKPMNFYENLGINHNGTILSYESREMPQEGEIFSMFSSGYKKTDYVLKMIVKGLENVVFYLEDSYTGESIPFGVGTSAYHFSVSTGNPLSTASDRFSIRVEDVVVGYTFKDGLWYPNNPSGVSTSATNILVINGSANLTADTQVNDLVIQAGATLEIGNVLHLNGDITNLGNLVFLSTSTQNGELGPVNAGSQITGKATVQRYMQNKRSYRMVTSSVTTPNSIHDNWQEGATSQAHNPKPGFGTHITGSLIDQQNGFDKTDTGNPSMFTVNVATQKFQPIGNTDVNILEAGSPYLLFVRGDRSIDLNINLAAGETTLRATGKLFTGTQTQTFSTASAGQFVMFGNPYQSAVNVNNVFASSTNLNTAYYYVYDPTLGDHGAYVTVHLSSGTNTSVSPANQFLQPGQGAQVAVLNASPQIIFNESDKAPGNYTSSSIVPNRLVSGNMLTVQLYTSENFKSRGPLHDSFALIFDQDNDNAITAGDAVKPMNFYENLAIDHQGTYLSIERRELPENDEIFQFYTNGFKHSEYTLKTIIDGLDDIALYLEDRFTGKSILLQGGENIYNFGVEASNPLSLATDRFYIRTEDRLKVKDNILLSNIRLYPNPLNTNTFYINAPRLNGEIINVTISDLSGRTIFNRAMECSSNTITIPISSDMATGVYQVTLKHKGEAQTYRLVRD